MSSSSSSSPTFFPSSFHVPKSFAVLPRNQSLPRKLPPAFPQLTSQLSIFSSVTLLTFPLSRNLHQCFSQRQSQSTQEKEQERDDQEELEIERLFSNLNQATLKREPGLWSPFSFVNFGFLLCGCILILIYLTLSASNVTKLINWL